MLIYSDQPPENKIADFSHVPETDTPSTNAIAVSTNDQIKSLKPDSLTRKQTILIGIGV